MTNSQEVVCQVSFRTPTDPSRPQTNARRHPPPVDSCRLLCSSPKQHTKMDPGRPQVRVEAFLREKKKTANLMAVPDITYVATQYLPKCWAAGLKATSGPP